uniref:Uncharacterized protein n=1 Tax=Myoviridae sp. ctBtT5 TaxID=2825048 RepID=A0A8S5PY10_9CAUD|nr:MAG TPA: hypothetical protein [Myoviridae sp. ctBtT5]
MFTSLIHMLRENMTESSKNKLVINWLFLFSQKRLEIQKK